MKELLHLTDMNLPVRKLIKGVYLYFTKVNHKMCIVVSYQVSKRE